VRTHYSSISIAISLALLSVLAAPLSAAELVKDINAQFEPGSSSLGASVDLSTVTLMVLSDGVHGAELWATDGTPGGTHLLKDINPGAADSNINGLTVINDVAYFQADDTTNGMELWRSDGTTAGTHIVVNIGPGNASIGGSFIYGAPQTTADNILYFSADGGSAGVELWRSDGTADGTYLLRPTPQRARSSGPAMARRAALTASWTRVRAQPVRKFRT
jgi:ELWxxDGT repeat protein